jgi:hypothetical protein
MEELRPAASVQLAVAWTAAAALFFVTSPYALLDWDTFSRAVLVEQGMMVRGVADLPFTRQYRDTQPYLLSLFNSGCSGDLAGRWGWLRWIRDPFCRLDGVENSRACSQRLDPGPAPQGRLSSTGLTIPSWPIG